MTSATTQMPRLRPLYITMDPADNVAIVVNDFGLPAGTEFACGLKLLDYVPQGHKVALLTIDAGAPIVRYAESIGHAARAIPKGSWVEESLVEMPDAPNLSNLPMPSGTVAKQEPQTGWTFEGYRNADGSVGTNNILAISTSVQCVAGTLDFAIKRIKSELLPLYPNIDDVIGITLQVFTTGRGTPYGLAAAPVIKVSTRTALAERWHDLIDFDAGRIATGDASIEETGWDLFKLILDVASGRKKTWADRWGIHNALTLFNPGPVT